MPWRCWYCHRVNDGLNCVFCMAPRKETSLPRENKTLAESLGPYFLKGSYKWSSHVDCRCSTVQNFQMST